MASPRAIRMENARVGPGRARQALHRVVALGDAASGHGPEPPCLLAALAEDGALRLLADEDGRLASTRTLRLVTRRR